MAPAAIVVAAQGRPDGDSGNETRRRGGTTDEAHEMSHSELLKRITARPEVFGGKPIIRDMRLSVELILSLMA